MKQKTTSIFLVVCLMFSLFVMPAYAENVTGGTFNNDMTWSLNLDTGLLVISGDGELWDSVDRYFPDVGNYVQELVIQGNITRIGTYTLYPYTQARSVTLPDSVTEICDQAFYGYQNIKEIKLPKKLKHIGNSVFAYCYSLESVVLPSGLQSIGSSNFYFCTSLKNIYIPETLSNIGAYCFSYCENLTTIRVNKGNIYYTAEDNVLYNSAKTRLIRYAPGKTNTSFTVPSTVTSIEEMAFGNSYNLKSITMSDNVKMIYASAFYKCTSLSDIYLSKNLQYLGAGAFSFCETLKSIVIPDDVTTLGHNTFSECTSLASVTAGKNLSHLDFRAFYGCGLVEFDTKNITSIGSEAFKGNYYLSKITFGEELVNIADYAFSDCHNLKSVTIPDNVSNLGPCTFYNCYALEEVQLGNNIATINSGTFSLCPNLSKVNIGSALVKVDATAFYGCESLREINLGPNIKTIGSEAFFECKNLNTVSLGKQLVSIDEYAFSRTNVTQVNYEGSEEDWSKVVVDEYGNNSLLTANFTFNYLPYEFIKYKEPVSYLPMDIKFSSGNGQAQIKYSDDFFKSSAYTYNHDLAKASLRLAVSAFATSKTEKQYSNVKNLLTNLNFEDISYNKWYTQAPERHSIGVISGKKHIKDPTGDYTLIAVAVRGGNYKNEWGGNFCVGTENLHEGFTKARDQVIDHIRKYVYNHQIYGKVKIWITGYSRAAATTNLTAALLDETPEIISDRITLAPKDIYAYCFETPMGVVNPNNESGLYNNIFSIVNPHDFVPMVAMRNWGFDRYGVTKYLPSRYTHGSYYNQFLKELKPLFEKYRGDKYTIDNAVYSGYPSGQNGYLENLINILATTVGSAENYTAEYQEVFEWLGEEILGKGNVQDFLNTLKEKLKDKKVILTVESGAVVLNPILPWDTAGVGAGSLYLTLRSVIIETFDALGVEVSPVVVNTIVEIALKIGVKDIVTLTNNASSLAQGHEPTLCMAWLDIIKESDFANGNTRTLKLTCPLPTNICDLNGNIVAQYNTKARTSSSQTLYSYTQEDGSITVYLPGNQEYSVEIFATDNAEISYSIKELDASTGNANITTYKTTVSKDDTLKGKIENLEEGFGNYPLALNEQQLNATKLKNAEPVTITTQISGNGNVTPTQICYPGETVTLIATPIEGEIFKGWYNGEYELVSEDETYSFTAQENTTLTAEFSQNTCEVLFKDGENTIEIKRIPKESSVNFPNAPEKDWYTFEGYYKDEDFGISALPNDIICEDTVIYAKYISDFSYTVDYGEEVTIDGYNGDKAHIVIPAEIEGYPVTNINYAAQFSDKIESISFPATITYIDYSPFINCTALKEFIVDENNESYYTIDGVLINKSMNYISCYPPGKTDVSFTIPETVTTISNITNPHLKELIMHENMFDISWYPLKDSAIDTIFYKGSQDSFNNVLNTYESPDGVLENAKVYYDYNNTPISAHLTCNYENSQFKGEISYKYMLTDCVAYIAVYNSENKLLKFTKVGEISKNQTAKTSISFPCPDPGSEGYAKILFLTDLSTLSPAGMWTAMDVFPL
ncbi:MAG: leucine-rich repeat protein [Clostridia bacterium]|nr:leucine-rich repeat protein [Clostridia bacterium]